MAAPRKAKFDTSIQYTWTNGTPFNGYIIVGIVVPTFDGTSATVWPDVNLADSKFELALPKGFAKVPIVNGKMQDLGLYYNEDLVPPLTQYVYYIYDMNNRQVAGPSSFFTVSATPITLPPLVIPNPSQTNALAPVPD